MERTPIIQEAARKSLMEDHMGKDSAEPAYTVHPSSFVDDGAEIGAETTIWHFTHICSGARLGRRCRVGQNVLIASGVHIGDNVKIQNNVSVYTGVILEDDVFCGPSMVFTNVATPRSAVPRNTAADFLETRVKQGATIGANATIVCGHTIGRFAFIGAGSVVTRDVPDYALVYGNPARLHGWACECGLRLPSAPDTVQCACGRRYRLLNGRLQPDHPLPEATP
jgi:UDP-2-acetamido-3-amino-2,3-dideoxy-glucuronate N-acetyltransferase